MKNRIKEIRKGSEYGKTQDSFAKYLGIPKSNLSSYEIGVRSPSKATIQLICEKCNINEEWLINGTGKKYCDNQNTPFKDRVLSSLNKLSDKEWEVLEKIYKEIN